MVRKTILALSGLVLLLVGAEAYARLGLGLGTPQLYETHPTMEYRLQANQSLHRFGNLFETNERHMRSPTLIGETRPIWLVLGDSIPLGGAQLDQKDLATSRLTNPTRMVANLSAASWGPANELAALKENADLSLAGIVVVLNSDDLPDVPTFAPLNPETHPTHPPVLALQEAVLRYLPRYLPNWMKPESSPQPSAAEWNALLSEGREDYREFLAGLVARGVPTCIVFHPSLIEILPAQASDTRAEARKKRADGFEHFDEMSKMAQAERIPVVQASRFYSGAANDLSSLYLDGLHLTATGQVQLARAIDQCMSDAIAPGKI